MVRAFIPQGRNSNINSNTNFPPQGEIPGSDIPPETFNIIDNLNNDFVDNLGNNLVHG